MIATLVDTSDDGLDAAARRVRNGGIVAYPTDTVYGLGCDPYQSDAVNRLVQAKQRSRGALPVLVDSMTVARSLGEFDKTSKILAGRFWPGPLTLIVPVREKMPEAVTDDTQFVGLRIPKHEIALKLITRCGGRLVGTSANISGHASPRTAEKVLEELGTNIDLVLDGGPTPLGNESTVVKTIGKHLSIMRVGAISQDELLMAIRLAESS
jgi:L-threonylcarbamoyladenylate synthase